MSPVLAERIIVNPPVDIRNKDWGTENFTCQIAGKTVTQSESWRQIGVMMYVVMLSVNDELFSYIEELPMFPPNVYLKTPDGWILFRPTTPGAVEKYIEALLAEIGLTASQWDECTRSFKRS